VSAATASVESDQLYAEDLAYVHDAGFGDQAEAAAEQLLELLATRGVESGTIIDLGCGGGIAAARVAAAGFDVFGIDSSPACIELARRRVPDGTFHVGSFIDAPLPNAVAVLAVGEVLGYLSDSRNGPRALPGVLARVHDAVEPEGIFLFDLSGPGRVGAEKMRTWHAGDDWALMVEAEEDTRAGTLTRQITSFRQTGDGYRRAEETHVLRLYAPNGVVASLHAAGFRARILRGYGGEEFARGHRAFLARRPE
jgi:SAM-dependent methyltransferase